MQGQPFDKRIMNSSYPGLTDRRSLAWLSALACLSLGTQAQTSLPAPSADGNAEVMLAPVTVQDSLASETATGPVSGFVARRAISATKTDTPLIETPQSISVVTRDQFEAQGVTTLRETTRYTAGINSSYFDNRVDSFKARGGDVSQYQDGLLRTYGTYNNIKVEPYTLERVEFLRGPSSVLYGQGSVGGVLNLTSKRPQAERMREVQIQLGSHGRKQIASDMTGAMDDEGNPTGADQAQRWMSTTPCMARSCRPRPPNWYVRPTWHSASSVSICRTSCVGAPGPRQWACVTTRPKPRPKVARQRPPTTLPPPNAWA